MDADGARVIGYNASLTGGFELHWPDGEHPPRSGAARVWVDGREWEWIEARFGGTLIVPLNWQQL